MTYVIKIFLLLFLSLSIHNINAEENEPYFMNTNTLGNAKTDEALDMLDSTFYAEDYDKVLQEKGVQNFGWKKERAIFRSTETTFGFLDAKAKKCSNHDKLFEISSLVDIDPDTTLKNSKVKLTLEAVRAKDYPGKNVVHEVLFEFQADNQAEGTSERVSYSLMMDIEEGERASVKSWPIFLGLNVGTEGVKFWTSVTNISNPEEKRLHNLLTSEVGTNGITLLETAQPVIKPFTSLITGISKIIATKNDNVRVHNIKMGLDFSQAVDSLKLREGTITAVQVPTKLIDGWSWSNWCYDTEKAMIVSKDEKKDVPYNYVSIGIKKM